MIERLAFEAPRTVILFTSLRMKSKVSPVPVCYNGFVNALIRKEVQEPNSKTQERTDMEYNTTIGVDVSDKTSKICVMAKLPGGERKIVVETTSATTKAGFEEAFSKFDRSWPVIFETGTHCRWMDK